MVTGKLKLFFSDGDKFNTFCEMIGLLQDKILPKDFAWFWESKEDGFEATLFSKPEASLQEERQTDDSSEPDDILVSPR